jgi:F-type H+-transporting ATPase subunit b
MHMLAPIVLTLLMATAAMGEEEGGAGVFSGTLAQSIAAIIVFILLFALLRKFAWGPILKGLQEREGKIKGDLERAEQAAQQAATTLKEYQTQLAEAQEEARKIIDKGRGDAQRVADQIKEQTQADITQMRKRAEQEIRGAKEQALTEIYTQTATLATAVAGKILRREIKGDDQERLVQESIRELGGAVRN